MISPTPPPDTAEDAELTQVLDAYLADLEAGRPSEPDRLVAEHPVIAERLRFCLHSLQLLKQGGLALSPALPAAEPPFPRLDDYQILREVGRGGMGVVYEAEQRSLGRRVALKVLPLAATLDPRRLQRFHNEARAVAQLRHPHIVPVHALGCEDDVHYYAMQFIEGQSLAALRRQWEQGEVAAPAPNWVLALGLQAAEALEYAHQCGILHRDVKPANLLLDDDEHLWVTDFGLARLPGDMGLTQTGDLVGTLRYVSPEQALGGPNLVDHRTDVYGLGATLYELLTLRPVHDGADRATLLRQLEHDEPIPPRRLNPAVSADLETVLLKALAKEPAERYATAQELADDLRRLLADEPIRARRPTLLKRFQKWAWRRRAGLLVLAAGVLAGLALSAGGVWRAYQREATQRQQAEGQRRQAQADRDLAHEAASQLVELANVWLPQEARIEEGHRQRLLRTLELLENLAERSAADPDGRHAAAGGFLRLAGLHRRVGEHATAGRCLERAIVLLEALVAEHPRGRSYRLELSRCYLQLGVLHQTTLQYAEAEGAHREAVRHSGQLVLDFPDHVPGLAAHAENLTALASVLGIRDLEQADEREELLRQALPVNEKLAERYPDHPLSYIRLTANLFGLGEIALERGRPAQAEKIYWRVVEMNRHVGRAFPDDLTLRAESTGVYRYLGRLLLDTGQWAEAEPVLREGRQVRHDLAGRYPTVIGHRLALAWDAALLGTACHALGKSDDAEAAFEEALNRLEEVRQRLPDDAESTSGLGRILADCPVERLRVPARAVELTREAARRIPDRPAFRINLGIAEYRAGNFRAAVQALEQGQKRRTGDEGEVWFFLAMSYGRLGDQEQARDYFARAVREMKARKPHSPELRRYRVEAETLLGGMPQP